MKENRRIELLRGVWLFEHCTRRELAMLVSSTATRLAAAGKTIVREGDVGREFFVLGSGRVEVSRNGVRIGTLEAGSFFGEMALLDRQPRAATVTADTSCELLVLTASSFAAVVETMPSVDRKIVAVLAERLRDIENRFLPEERFLSTSERLLARATS